MLEFGCDPALKDKNGKYPYNLAATKDGRKVFMRFQAKHPEMYDYSKVKYQFRLLHNNNSSHLFCNQSIQAHIPGPLTKEMEEERAERQKAMRKIKKDKEQMKIQLKKEKQAQIDEKNRFLNLSEREKVEIFCSHKRYFF